MLWVYMVICADGSYYIGVTNDVTRRIWEHNHGLETRSYTFKRRPVRLVYASQGCDPDAAIAWEKQIKKWSRKKKEALIAGDWDRLKAISREIRLPRRRFDTSP